MLENKERRTAGPAVIHCIYTQRHQHSHPFDARQPALGVIHQTEALGPEKHTGRIGSRQQLAGGVPWGCPGGALRSCGDHLHPIQLGLHGKPLF